MPVTSPSVLIIRLDGIGDALALVPLLAALRRRSIPTDVVLTERNACAFAADAIRAALVAPFALRSGTAANRRAIAEFGAALRARTRYSHVLVATEDPGGYRLASAVGAPVRAGFFNGWGKPFKSLWVRGHLNRPLFRTAGLDRRAPHECAVLFRLGRAAGIDGEPPRDARELRPLVLDEPPLGGEYVALQITDKWERLGVALDDVLALVRALRARGATVRCLAAAAESGYAGRVESALGEPVERFADLRPWKAALASARAVVAPDSGALHVAGMTGTPVVGIFPPGPEYALQTARWAPWAAPHRLFEALPQWHVAAAGAVVALAERAPSRPR